MSRVRVFWMAILVALLGFAPAQGAEDPAEGVLKSKSLKRSGTTYVVPEEAAVQKKLAEARNLYKQYTVAAFQQRAYAQGTEEKKAFFKELMQRRSMLNQQLGQASSVAEHNQIVTSLNEINDRMRLIQDEEADPKAKDDFNAKAAHQREVFVQAVIDLRQLIDRVNEHYNTLGQDTEVKDALAALNKKTKAKLTLGPSRLFLANVKLVEKVEASVLTESVMMRKEHNVFWLDATFNGKITEPVIFDTGASLTTISTELAKKLGLNPGPSDPTIHCTIADGSVIEAKKMTIPSIRVGKFTIKEVECAVMPPTKADVSPLLGGSFTKYFDYKIVPDTGKLVLSKVETPDEPKAAPKSKSAKTAKSKR